MKQKITLLYVEDDYDDYILMKACLDEIPGKQFDIAWAQNYQEALSALKEANFDVCLFDFRLGGNTGLDLLREARAIPVEAPIIMLTGMGDRLIDEEAMRLGATDYLIKSELQPEPLERSIRYAIEHANVMKALKGSEHKYRSIFEGSIDVIYLLDENGIFTDVSPSITQLLGYSPDELTGRSLISIFASEPAAQAFQSLQSMKANIRDFEAELLAVDGARKFCIITSIHHIADEERPAYFQGFIHDITQRKKAEQQLLIVEKLAATGRFVRMLGHEIRNPLTNINLSVEQIALENKDTELEDYIDIIRRNTQRIGKLLNDLLESSNPGRLEFKVCSAQAVVEKTLEIAKDRIRLKAILIHKDFQPNPVLVQADEEKLKIALLNIIINAVEVMEERKGELRLSVQSDHTFCQIVISDNGPGIPRDNLGRIFDPYFSRKSNGLGLGLSTTLTIVRSHNGRIEVKSEEGKGAEFTIFLPFINQETLPDLLALDTPLQP